MADTAAASAIELPDDAVREILARVADAATLFSCATMCKRWRALVADLFFLRRRWPEDSPGSSSLFGFFARKERGGEPVFVGAPRAPLGIGSCSLGLFFPAAAAGLLHRAEPLASRHGLLLVRLHHRVSKGAIHLAICNPFTGTCDVLPPLECIEFYSAECYAILTGEDCRSNGEHQSPSHQGYSAFFKVLVIGSILEVSLLDDSSDEYVLHMFSSSGSSWTVFRECFPQHDFMASLGSVVVCRGTAYWLFKNTSSYYTLQVRADTGHLSIAKLSIQPDNFGTVPWLSIDTDGTLSLLCLRQQGDQVDKWTRQDGDGSAEWICTRLIEVRRSKETQSISRRKMQTRSGEAQVLCVCEGSNMLLFMDPRVHIADLETGRAEYVTGQFNGLDEMRCVPFVVDWAAFFLSRLGGRNYLGLGDRSLSHARNISCGSSTYEGLSELAALFS